MDATPKEEAGGMLSLPAVEETQDVVTLAISIIMLVVCIPLVATNGAAMAQSRDSGVGNLLRNPDFELVNEVSKVPYAWWPSCTGGSRAEFDSSIARSGKRSAKIIKVRDGTSHVAAIAQDVEVEPNTEYILSGFARSEMEGGQALLFGYEYDASGKWLQCTPGAVAPEMVEGLRPIRVAFTTGPTTTRVQVRFEIYGKESLGVAWVDDVYFGKKQDPPRAPRRLEAVYDGKGAVRLEWDPVSSPIGPVTYNIYRGTFLEVVPSPKLLVATVSENEWTDTGVEACGIYYYAVTAMDRALNEGEPAVSGRISTFGQDARIPDYLVWWEVATRKVGRDIPATVPHEGPAIIKAARNEYEPFQVVISARNKELSHVRVEVSDLVGPDGKGISAENIELTLPYYLKITTPSHVAFSPGYYPDPLPPVREPFDVPLDMSQPVWVTVYIPEDAPPGEYSGTVRISPANADPQEIPVRLTVWDFTLPVESHQGSAFAIWGDQVAEAHGVSMASLEYFELYEKYYWFLTERRLSPTDLPWLVTSPKAERVLSDPRIVSFRIPHRWGSLDDPEFGDTVAYLREKGWLSKGYVYCYDEPSEEQYPYCRQLADKVHEAGRDVKFLLTEQPEEELFGCVDIWCPNLAAFDPVKAAERQKEGEEVWWYTCVGPNYPYPTYFIDDEAISPRMLSWLQAKYNVQGTLYWSTTIFKKYDSRLGAYVPRDILKDPMAFPGANGDGYLLYPGVLFGIDGPVSSVRLELIREGNEDFEYFWLLKQAVIAAKERGALPSDADPQNYVREIVDRVATDLTHWTRDPDALYAAREHLAKEIMQISKLDDGRTRSAF